MSTFASASRDARLDFRLSREHKRIIEQAATIVGQKVSDFAVSNLVRMAQETIDETMVTRLSARDRNVFLKMLDADARPNKALRTAAKRYKKRRG